MKPMAFSIIEHQSNRGKARDKKLKILPVILSGGSGTRLWPVSRSDYPKQLQELCGDHSLLQQTVLRLPCDEQMAAPVVICNAQQRFLIAEQLRGIGVAPSQIILEPVARSTAAALAIPALGADDPANTVLVAMPADHFIADQEAFSRAIKQAAALALGGKLMTLGVKPTKAHTGFGYIQQGAALSEDAQAYEVTQFKEKPDEATAQAYLQAGTYLWNAGIFVFRADCYLAELERLQPQIVAACRQALERSQKDLDFVRLDPDAFAQSPNLSIDYAIMEQAANVGVLPVAFDWSDIGGWPALWQLGSKDENDNVVKGDALLKDSHRCYIRSEDRLVAAIGLEDLVIVDTSDALLVATRDRADEVKDIVAQIKKAKRSEADTHQRVWRPWGYYESLDSGDRFQVKQIMVKPGGRLSLQMHHHRAEHWVVVSGTARVTCGDKISLLGPNETAYIPMGEVHRLENPGLLPLFLVEVQSGDYLGEDDIVRIEDLYKRGNEETK